MVRKVRGLIVRRFVDLCLSSAGESTLPISDEMKEEIQRQFGDSLRQMRHEADLSQEELAHRADLDRSYVGSVERGERNITLLNVVRLARALSVPPAELLNDL